MNLNESLKINEPQVVHETIDGETILLNLDSGTYYSLDDIGAAIWELIEKNYTIGDIVKNIARYFKDDQEVIEDSIKQFVSELLEDALVDTVEGGQHHGPDDLPHLLEKFGGDNLNFIAPVLNKYTDMQDLLLLDPIHDVDDTGWPSIKTD